MATAEQNCNDQITAYDQTADQMSGNRVLKYYTVTLGNTLGRDPGIEKKLHEFIPGLKNVLNSQECDFILVFLHFDLRAGTDIEEAVKIINTLSGDKPAILVVLHHTFDLKATVPDSSGAVNRKNTNTVDLLYCKDTGLLTCFQNDQALSTVINWINPENILNMGPRQSQIEDPVTNLVLKTHTLKHFTLATGNTLGLDKYIERTLQERIPGLQKVQNLEECDIILVFCPVVSQKDIETAVMRLRTLPDKPAVVVVLHHTSAPNTIVPDSSGAVNRKNTITVDLLFFKDIELLACYKNDEALSKVINWINPDWGNSFEDISNSGPRQSQTHDQMLKNPHLKHFTVVTGNTFSCDVGLERKFEELIEGLQKVQKLEECDFILFFCHVDSEFGTDIEPALNLLSSIPGNKPAVVMVLHHRSDPNTIVPDSSGAVNRKNTITVDFMFRKNVRLVECYENYEALSRVIDWINLEDITKMGPRQSQKLQNPHPKYFTLVTGKTLGHDAAIERELQELIPGLQKVQDLEKCDFILVFCPVVSRAGTDIEAAVKKLNTLPGNPPTVLVVLHHTFNPESVVPDSSRSVHRDNTLTVDCLFYEDQGLLHCFKNNEALSEVINWLHLKGILIKPAKQTQSIIKNNVMSLVKNLNSSLETLFKCSNKDHTAANQLLKCHPIKHFRLNTGNTLGHDVDLERKLQELVPGLQKVQKLEECDFILLFCPVVSRAGTDIEAAMKELNTLSGTKPAALMVLHHTFNPEEIVPDSRMAVKRDNLIAVDCLFHEDHGLLRCNKNNEAYILVSDWIKTQVLPKTKKGTMLNNKRKHAD